MKGRTGDEQPVVPPLRLEQIEIGRHHAGGHPARIGLAAFHQEL